MPTVTVQEAFQRAFQCHQAGRLAEAESVYRQILAVEPAHAGALQFLGVIEASQGHYDLAESLLKKALVMAPESSSAHCNLGRVLGEQNRWNEAVDSFRRAIQIEPHLAEAHINLGNALRRLGHLEDAVSAYHRALQLQADSPAAWYNLGNALRDQGRLGPAVEAFRRVLRIQPHHPEACLNLGNALKEQGHLEQALGALMEALRWRPDYADAFSSLGIALREKGCLDEAVSAGRRAIALAPNDADAHNNLGTTLKDQSRLDEAMLEFRRALELQPDHAGAHHNLIYTLHFDPRSDERTIAAEQRRWNRRLIDALKPRVQPCSNDRNAGRRLRVGYISSDFRGHVVGRNLLPLFRRHDRERFEVFCYSSVVLPDEFTEEFRRLAQHWRHIVGVSDDALCEMIRADGIDILVDLGQHMAGNRLPVFARQPAPVQASFAGYPGSTGLETIRYRISDRYLEDPAGGDQSNQEQVFLIDSFWCYDPCGVDLAVNALPALQTGSVTFGSLNNFCKINEAVLRLWGRVLGMVADSRLLILADPGSHRQDALEVLRREGVEPSRVEFVGVCPRQAYLETYHRLDIILDPFPYGGHTTSLDAFWMGVPVVSLIGRRPVSRAGLSHLAQLGLSELAAFCADDYVRIAAALAHDLPRLEKLRGGLRSRMEASPLMDAPRFARDIETAYRTMWRQC